MKTDELLKMQALKFKNEVMERNPDFENDESVPAWMRETYDATGEVRNICGMIPLSLFEINRVSESEASASVVSLKWPFVISRSARTRHWMKLVLMQLL